MASAETGRYVIAGRGPGRATIGVRGALAGSTIAAFDSAARDAMEPGMDLVVDLNEATSVSAEGLGALAAVRDVVRADGGSFQVRPPASGAASGDALAELNMTAYYRSRAAHPAAHGS